PARVRGQLRDDLLSTDAHAASLSLAVSLKPTEPVSSGAMEHRPVRWGILSTGAIAATFTEDLARSPDAEVVAVGSRTEAAAKAFADRYGIPRAYGSWPELAADDDVDVVYVATPHSAH